MNRAFYIMAAALLGWWWFSREKPKAAAAAGSLASADSGSGGLWPTSWPTFNFGAPNILGESASFAGTNLPKGNAGVDPGSPPTPGFSGNPFQPTAVSNLPYAGGNVSAGTAYSDSANRSGLVSKPKRQVP